MPDIEKMNAFRDMLPEMPGQLNNLKRMPTVVQKGGVLAHVQESLMAMQLSRIANAMASDDPLEYEKAQDRVEKLYPYMLAKKSEVKITNDNGAIDGDTKEALAAYMKERQRLAVNYEDADE
jgi:hypothetical protein